MHPERVRESEREGDDVLRTLTAFICLLGRFMRVVRFADLMGKLWRGGGSWDNVVCGTDEAWIQLSLTKMSGRIEV